MQRYMTLYARAGRAAILLIVSHVLWAQTPGTGAISGTVSDPSGAMIATAKVTVRNEETRATRSVVTTDEGAFRVPLLPPGSYSISAEASGFGAGQMHSVHVGASEIA